MDESDMCDLTEEVLLCGTLGTVRQNNLASTAAKVEAPGFFRPNNFTSASRGLGSFPNPFRPMSTGLLSQNRQSFDTHSQRQFSERDASMFRPHFPFGQSFRPDFSTSPSTMFPVPSPYNISGQSTYHAGKSNTLTRKTLPPSSYGLCESCFKPVGHHSKTCPHSIRQEEEKEQRKTRVIDPVSLNSF
jgi:hypothetical protein